MFWSLSFLAIVLANAAPAKMPAPQPMHAHLLLAAWEAPPAYDAHAEKELLELANRARAQAGLAPFGIDDGLTHAAREHATAMARREELSHQFSGGQICRSDWRPVVRCTWWKPPRRWPPPKAQIGLTMD